MNLIKSKFTSRQYSSLDQLVQDYYQIYNNCILYNENESYLVIEANRQKDVVSDWYQQNNI